MPQLIYPTSRFLFGPWLIDAKQLDELDRIFDNAESQFSNYRASKIDQAVEAEAKRYGYRKKEELAKAKERISTGYDYRFDRVLRIFFDDDVQMVAKSFKEAATDPSVKGKSPIGFTYTVNSGNLKSEVELSKHKDGLLSYSINPSPSPDTQEIEYQIEKWRKSMEPNDWVRLWRIISGYIWYAFVFLLFALMVFSQSRTDLYRDQLKANAREMLNDTLTQNNSLRALRILLSLESDYVPKDFKPNASRFGLATPTFLIIALLVTLILSTAPKNAFAIGAGELAVKHRRLWIKLISVTLPGSVILPLLLQRIGGLF